ncbi:MAG TPA: hypothetical protein VIN59_01155 [Alphaproteobacteria bacterium]
MSNDELAPKFDEQAGKTSRVGGGIQYDTEVTVGEHYTIVSSKQRDFEKFRIMTTSSYTDVEEEARRAITLGFEEKLGFKFPGGAPVLQGHGMGYEFEDKPKLELPAGWEYRNKLREPRQILLEIFDDQGRFRGYLHQMSNDRASIQLWPRVMYTRDIEISGERKERTYYSDFYGQVVTEYSSGMHYWLTGIKLLEDRSEKIALPCILFVNSATWSTEGLDFVRINRDEMQIHKAQYFMANEIAKMFPGAGHASTATPFDMRYKADIFAHWDEDVQAKLSELRTIFEDTLPKIIRPDNCLVLKLFPTNDELTEWKQNRPLYEAPTAKP